MPYPGNDSAEERKRRQVYRGDVHGQLPFDLKGMDNTVLTIDFSPIGQVDDMYSLERQDAEGERSAVQNFFSRSWLAN